MKLLIKDEEGEEHIVECDNIRCYVIERILNIYEGGPKHPLPADETSVLVGSFNFKWFKLEDK